MSSLAKERMSHNSVLSSFPYGVVDQYQVADHIQKSSGFNNNFTENSKGIMFQATNFQSGDQEAQSVINFKGGFNSSFMNNSQSMLNFEHNNQWNHNIINIPKLTTDPSHLSSNFNNFEAVNQSHDDIDDESNGWYYTEATIVTDCFDKSLVQDSTGNHKRPRNMGAECSTQASKKQCSSSSSSSANKNKPKPKSSTQAASKDPQSIAAKNRRERISERLKVLQELVPNGSKVDLVTMLEKAINYVKFLQLQVKVLATDEFWPVQGGKPPDITQVKEAIDAILSSSQLKDTSKKNLCSESNW